MVAETAQQASGIAGALGSLGVNAKLFLAQLLNFGVVVFVMWRWVYRPLMKVLDERTKRIEQGLADAEAAGSARQAAEQESGAIVAEARMKAKGIIDEAAATAERDRAESSKKARAEVEKVVDQGREQLRLEKERMLGEVKSELGGLVAAATERVLRQKLDRSADERLIAEAIKEVDRV